MGLEAIIPAALAGALAVLVIYAVRGGAMAVKPAADAVRTTLTGGPASDALASRRRLVLVLVALIAVLLLAWFWRFDVYATSHGNQSVAYKLDRWTGAMSFCTPQHCDTIQ